MADPSRESQNTIARLHLWQIQAVRDALMVLAIIALVWFGYALRAVTVPLLVALLLAYLFEPLVARVVARTQLNRPVVVGGLMATVGLALAVILFIATLTIVNQSARLIDDFRSGRFEQRAEHLLEFVPVDYREPFEEFYRRFFDPIEEIVAEPEDADDEGGAAPERGADEPVRNEGLDHATPQLTEEERIRQIVRDELYLSSTSPTPPVTGVTGWWSVITGGADRILSIVLGLIAFGFLLFLIPFYLFFFSMAYPSIVAFGKSLIPEGSQERTLELLGKMDRVIAGFVRGRIIVSLLMGIGFAIGWWWIGVPYAILLGFVVGLFCAVPFLGIIGVPLAIGLLFFEQLNYPPEERMVWWAIILWPTVVFVIVQAIESYAITPIIAGKATNLDPVTIIVAVLAGGSLMGVYGMLLAIPVAACVKILITDVLLPRIRAWTKGEAADPLPLE